MKMTLHLNRFFLLLVFVFGITYWTVAQVKVDSDQDVGIGTSATDNSKLKILNDANQFSLKLENKYTGNNTKRGLYNKVTADGSGAVYGFRNIINQNANAPDHAIGVRSIFNETVNESGSKTYGIFNNISVEGTNLKYGIFNRVYCGLASLTYGSHLYIEPDVTSTGQIFGSYIDVKNAGTGNQIGLFSRVHPLRGLAGDFRGNVEITGNLVVTGNITGNASDETLKENIKALENSLELISNINPKTFNFLKDNDLCLPEGNQYGVLAQEIEKVLPDLVGEVIHKSPIPSFDPDSSAATTEIASPKVQRYKTVNYQAFIPILIGAVKEQQAQLNKQQKQIEEMQAIIAELKK